MNFDHSKNYVDFLSFFVFFISNSLRIIMRGHIMKFKREKCFPNAKISLTITAKPFRHNIWLWHFLTKVPHLHYVMRQYNVKRVRTSLLLHYKLTVIVKFFWHNCFSTNICSGYDMHEDDVWYLAFQVYAHQTAIRKKITQT